MANLSSCPSPVKTCRRSKVVYRVRNWPAYDAGLQQRGSLTVWCTPQAVQAWYYQGPPQRGAQYTFSAVAIQTAWTLRLLYHLPLRQTEGFVASVLALMGLDLRVPDHTTSVAPSGGFSRGVAAPAGRRTDPLGGGFNRAESVWRRRMEGASARLEQAAHLAQIAPRG